MWESVRNGFIKTDFFQQLFLSWLERNILDETRKIQGIDWSLVFVAGCYLLWFSRNLFILGNQINAHAFLTCRVLKLAADYDSSMDMKVAARKRIPLVQLLHTAWGLTLALSLGIPRVCLETNSSSTCNLVDEDALESHTHIALISFIKNLVGREWSVRISHVCHEANKCADGLARLGHSLPLGLTFFYELPACISLEFFLQMLQVSVIPELLIYNPCA